MPACAVYIGVSRDTYDTPHDEASSFAITTNMVPPLVYPPMGEKHSMTVDRRAERFVHLPTQPRCAAAKGVGGGPCFQADPGLLLEILEIRKGERSV